MPLQLPNPNTLYLKIIGVALVVGAIFAAGWNGHRWFAKPVEKIITVKIPVEPGPPDGPKPSENHEGVVKPGVQFGAKKEQPAPPTVRDLPPLPNPTDTTIIHIPVPTAMKLDVFHQNQLQWLQEGDHYRIWSDMRIWARDEHGNIVPGMSAETIYNRDAHLELPITVKVQCPKERPWATGLVKTFNPAGWGLFLDRDLGPLRVGVEATTVNFRMLSTEYKSTMTNVKLGLRF
jgi:hypothetical protein